MRGVVGQAWGHGDLSIHDVIVIDDVIAPVILAVHVNGNDHGHDHRQSGTHA